MSGMGAVFLRFTAVDQASYAFHTVTLDVTVHPKHRSAPTLPAGYGTLQARHWLA